MFSTYGTNQPILATAVWLRSLGGAVRGTPSNVPVAVLVVVVACKAEAPLQCAAL